MKFIEVMTMENEKTVVNVEQIVRIKKTDDGVYLFLSTDSANIKINTTYEDIKRLIIQTATDSAYNDANEEIFI